MHAEASARSRLAEARVAHLATTGSDGHPHLVPFCFALEAEMIYSAVDWKPKATQALRRLENIRQNALVSVLADHYEELWDRLWWVRVDGVGEVLPEGDAARHGRSLLASKYEQYAARPPTGPVLRIEARRWSSWP